MDELGIFHGNKTDLSRSTSEMRVRLVPSN